jgi:hypothetical protein
MPIPGPTDRHRRLYDRAENRRRRVILATMAASKIRIFGIE